MAFGINKLTRFISKILGRPTLIDTKLGSAVVIRPGVQIKNVELEDYCFIGPDSKLTDSMLGRHTYVSSNVQIRHSEIGAFCSIAPEVIIGMGSHPTDLVSTHPAFYAINKGYKTFGNDAGIVEYDGTSIGHDVWIGTRAMIPGGVEIGTGAIIAAGSVVTKNIEPYSIVGGVPAKFIRYRFGEEKRKKLLNSRWWELSEKELEESSQKYLNPSDFLNEL